MLITGLETENSESDNFVTRSVVCISHTEIKKHCKQLWLNGPSFVIQATGFISASQITMTGQSVVCKSTAERLFSENANNLDRMSAVCTSDTASV